MQEKGEPKIVTQKPAVPKDTIDPEIMKKQIAESIAKAKARAKKIKEQWLAKRKAAWKRKNKGKKKQPKKQSSPPPVKVNVKKISSDGKINMGFN